MVFRGKQAKLTSDEKVNFSHFLAKRSIFHFGSFLGVFLDLFEKGHFWSFFIVLCTPPHKNRAAGI